MASYERPIRCYVSPSGRNKIEQWYQGLSVGEQADADVFIGRVRGLREWGMPYYRMLFVGIGELRWPSGGKQQRLLGFFDGETWIALIGCSHKQSVYKPPTCLKTARVRKKEVGRAEVMTVEFDL